MGAIERMSLLGNGVKVGGGGGSGGIDKSPPLAPLRALMPSSSSSRSFSSDMVCSCSITSRHCLRRRLRSQKMAAWVSGGK
jgi:hypothetical protein